jgi:hypothetical protein
MKQKINKSTIASRKHITQKENKQNDDVGS